MPKLNKPEEKLWGEAKSIVGKQKGKPQKKFKDTDWALTNKIFHLKKEKHLGKKKKKKKSNAELFLTKVAVSIVIEPTEPLIQRAVDLVEQKSPGLFTNSGVSRIVVESGDPGHFGKAESDKADTIFVSVDKIKALINSQGSGPNEEEVVKQIALTIAHELAHQKSKFVGGEAPAEAEEKQMEQKLSSILNRSKVRKLALRAEAADPTDLSTPATGEASGQLVGPAKLEIERRVKQLLNQILSLKNAIAERQQFPENFPHEKSYINLEISKRQKMLSDKERLFREAQEFYKARMGKIVDVSDVAALPPPASVIKKRKPEAAEQAQSPEKMRAEIARPELENKMMRGEDVGTAEETKSEPAPMEEASEPDAVDFDDAGEPDPAEQFFSDELAAAKAFIGQGKLDDAKELLNSILEDVPESVVAERLLASISGSPASTPSEDERSAPDAPAAPEAKVDESEELLDEADADVEPLSAKELEDVGHVKAKIKKNVINHIMHPPEKERKAVSDDLKEPIGKIVSYALGLSKDTEFISSVSTFDRLPGSEANSIIKKEIDAAMEKMDTYWDLLDDLHSDLMYAKHIDQFSQATVITRANKRTVLRAAKEKARNIAKAIKKAIRENASKEVRNKLLNAGEAARKEIRTFTENLNKIDKRLGPNEKVKEAKKDIERVLEAAINKVLWKPATLAEQSENKPLVSRIGFGEAYDEGSTAHQKMLRRREEERVAKEKIKREDQAASVHEYYKELKDIGEEAERRAKNKPAEFTSGEKAKYYGLTRQHELMQMTPDDPEAVAEKVDVLEQARPYAPGSAHEVLKKKKTIAPTFTKEELAEKRKRVKELKKKLPEIKRQREREFRDQFTSPEWEIRKEPERKRPKGPSEPKKSMTDVPMSKFAGPPDEDKKPKKTWQEKALEKIGPPKKVLDSDLVINPNKLPARFKPSERPVATESKDIIDILKKDIKETEEAQPHLHKGFGGEKDLIAKLDILNSRINLEDAHMQKLIMEMKGLKEFHKEMTQAIKAVGVSEARADEKQALISKREDLRDEMAALRIIINESYDTLVPLIISATKINKALGLSTNYLQEVTQRVPPKETDTLKRRQFFTERPYPIPLTSEQIANKKMQKAIEKEVRKIELEGLKTGKGYAKPEWFVEPPKAKTRDLVEELKDKLKESTEEAEALYKEFRATRDADLALQKKELEERRMSATPKEPGASGLTHKEERALEEEAARLESTERARRIEELRLKREKQFEQAHKPAIVSDPSKKDPGELFFPEEIKAAKTFMQGRKFKDAAELLRSILEDAPDSAIAKRMLLLAERLS